MLPAKTFHVEDDQFLVLKTVPLTDAPRKLNGNRHFFASQWQSLSVCHLVYCSLKSSN